MRVMHVVHTHPLLGSTGGTELYVEALAAARGDLVFTRDEGPGLRRQDNLWMAGVPRGTGFRGSWSSPAVSAALAEVVEREKPDLLHVHHMAHLDLSPPPGPYLLTLHDYHLACARGQLVNQASELCEGPSPQRCGTCVASQLRTPSRLAGLGELVHALGMSRVARAALEAAPPSESMKDEVRTRNEAGRAVLAGAQRVLSPSSVLARRFESLGLVDRVHVQDLPLVGPVDCRERQPGPTRFLFVGSLLPTKAPMLLLRAFSQLPSGTLDIWGPKVPYFGSSEYAEGVARVAQRTPRARYRGVFKRQHRSQVYGDADVLVVPSTWPENSPLVVREALAAGLRVVATKHGGVGEIDPEARLVAPGDVDALARALEAELVDPRRREARDFPMDEHLAQLSVHYAACSS
jgi:glycosyltransferase involved in cell wall biosynthesis